MRRNNIEWARRLEEAGVHVAYGNPDRKIHSKLCLVVRDEATGVRAYAHIGTGNYNSRTARVYTDLGLFTADRRHLRRRAPACSTTSPACPTHLETTAPAGRPANLRDGLEQRVAAARSSTPAPAGPRASSSR